MSVSCSLIPRVTHKSLGMRLVSKYTFKIASLGQYCMQFLNGFPQLSIVCEKKKNKKKKLLNLLASMMAFSIPSELPFTACWWRTHCFCRLFSSVQRWWFSFNTPAAAW